MIRQAVPLCASHRKALICPVCSITVAQQAASAAAQKRREEGAPPRTRIDSRRSQLAQFSDEQIRAIDTDARESILVARRRTEPPSTLAEIGNEWGVSRARVQAIEKRLVEKLLSQRD